MLLTSRIDRTEITTIQNKILKTLQGSDKLNRFTLSTILKTIPNISQEIFLTAFWELCEQDAVFMDSNRKVWI